MVNGLGRADLFHSVWLIFWVVYLSFTACGYLFRSCICLSQCAVNSLGRVRITLSQCVVNSLGRVAVFHNVWLIVWVV